MVEFGEALLGISYREGIRGIEVMPRRWVSVNTEGRKHYFIRVNRYRWVCTVWLQPKYKEKEFTPWVKNRTF